MNIKITKADRYFSLCVRERANNTCERCGREYVDGGRGLQCAHFETRRNKAVRFDPDNAFALCFACHTMLDGSPVEFVKFYKLKRGIIRYNALVETMRNIMLGKAVSKLMVDMAYWWEGCYNVMLTLRA